MCGWIVYYACTSRIEHWTLFSELVKYLKHDVYNSLTDLMLQSKDIKPTSAMVWRVARPIFQPVSVWCILQTLAALTHTYTIHTVGLRFICANSRRTNEIPRWLPCCFTREDSFRTELKGRGHSRAACTACHPMLNSISQKPRATLPLFIHASVREREREVRARAPRKRAHFLLQRARIDGHARDVKLL